MKRAIFLMMLAGQALAERPVALEWPEVPFIQLRMAYLGASMLPPVPSDHITTQREFLSRAPFVQSDQGVGVDLDSLPPEFAVAATGGKLSASDFHQLAAKAYFAKRPFPAQLAALHAELNIGSSRWETVEVSSLITQSRRRIHFPADEVIAATLERREIAPGTTFLAAELDAAGQVRETHAARMRADHRMDFTIYDAQGARRADSENFHAPMQCFTCHSRNAQRASPFREFPAPAPANNGFQPAVHETLGQTEASLVQRMARPKQDSDVFGDYAGLAAVKLQRRAAAGPVEPWVSALLARVAAQYPQN